MIRSLIDGAPWLGTTNATPLDGAVALIDTEMSAFQLDDWLRAQRIGRDDQVIVIPLRGAVRAFDLLDDDVRTAWIERFRILGVKYLILDCLRPVLDVLSLDEHHDAGRFLVALDELLLEAGIPECLVVHHTGHAGERSRGDSRLRDWPDVEWRLVREKPDDPASARFLTAFGRDVDQPEQRLDCDADTRQLTLAGGSRRDARLDKALAAVLDVQGVKVRSAARCDAPGVRSQAGSSAQPV